MDSKLKINVRDTSRPPTKIFGTSKNDARGQNFEILKNAKNRQQKNMNLEV